jgi:hypothetical protein
MRLLALVIGVLIMLVGAIEFVAPEMLLSLGRSMITPAGLYVIAAVRIALGLILVSAAPASRTPRMLRVLGAVVIIAGVMTPVFGVARSLAVVDWWASAGRWFMRLVAVVPLVVGGFLVYVFRPVAAAGRVSSR